jgi:UDP-glucose 4-epimerase
MERPLKRDVLVTGGAGFIGSALARALGALGHGVVVADNLSTGERANVPPDAHFIQMDLADRAHYHRLENTAFDAVFHLAAQSSGEASFGDPWYDFNSHATATFLLLDLCRRRGVERFLYASSMAVYGDPQYLPVDEAHPTRPKTFYAAGKLAAESYVRLHSTLGVDTTIFRMFSVYGPNQNIANRMQGMASIYLSYLLEGKPVVVKGSKERFRDLVYIDDVVQAWLLAWDNASACGKTYNLGTGRQTTVEQLLRALLDSFGDRDYPVEYAAGTPGDQHGMVACVDKLRRELAWTPVTPLATGLAAMVKSYTDGK